MVAVPPITVILVSYYLCVESRTSGLGESFRLLERAGGLHRNVNKGYAGNDSTVLSVAFVSSILEPSHDLSGLVKLYVSTGITRLTVRST
jgi:hypothetical protein